jgi:WD40 repeat protein
VRDSLNGRIVRGHVNFRDHQKGIFNDYPYGTQGIALAPDGRRVAFMGIDNTILVFDMLYKDDSDLVLPHSSSVLAGHVAELLSVAFSCDGNYLATTSNDRTIRIWDLPAILKHNQHSKSASCDSEDFNLDETWIAKDGWAGFTIGDDGNPPLRRLIWVPEILRDGLCRSSNVRVVGRQFKETRLDFGNFLHGRNWEKCWLRPDSEHS